MKLSDKALRQIGRKLLGRTDTPTNQEDSPNPVQQRVTPSRSLRQWPRQRTRAADVLPFTKRRR